MNSIWGCFGLVLLGLAFLNVVGISGEGASVALVGLHSIFALVVLLGSSNRYRNVFAGAFLVRFLFMLCDLYAQDIFTFPNSGADSEFFYYYAVNVSQNISLLSEPLRGGIYSKIVGLLFYWVGPYRIVGQYLNVLLGLSTVAILGSILKMLSVRARTMRVSLLLAAFFPNSLIMSAIFLREIAPTFFVAASLYYFVRYFMRNQILDMLLTLIMIGCAAAFHTGVIGLLLGYSFVFLFYKLRTDRYRFSLKTIIVFFLLFGVVSVAATKYRAVFFKKVDAVEEAGDIYTKANRRQGNSAYLAGLEITSPVTLGIYGPFKMIYFLASPVPWDWRGFVDIGSFFTDSLLYIGTLFYVVWIRRKLRRRKSLTIALLTAILGATIIFGIGVSNAGTAIRHRQKLTPVFLVLLAVAMDERWRHKAWVRHRDRTSS